MRLAASLCHKYEDDVDARLFSEEMAIVRSRFRLILRLVLAAAVVLPVVAQQSRDWTAPLPPFQIADHLYYVGSRDLAAYLIATPAGNILINANLPSSPRLIRASIEKLGLRWRDTRILLDSQAHFDHMGGAAEVVRETGAKDMAMEGDAAVARSGGRDDFARISDGLTLYPPVRVDRVLHDGDTVTLGGITLTAHKTAGHTRGCTTWTLRLHVPGDPVARLRNIVIVGGWSPLSHYQLVSTPGRSQSYPGIAADFQHTFATLRALPCDIFLGAHGGYFNLLPKLARMKKEGDAVWIDPQGYHRAVDDAEAAFNRRLQQQEQAANRP